MAWISVLVCLGIFIASGHCDSNFTRKVFKRDTDEVCPGKPITLTEGKISIATLTGKSIEQEANENMQSLLFKAFNALKQDPKYDEIIKTGESLGLTEVETQAVRLYTMDSIGLFGELNRGLREGNNEYPVLHYWIDSALKKLPKYNDFLYHGYGKTANIDIGTKLRLPGFTSASEAKHIAQTKFSFPGCTILVFDSSKQAGSVIKLSKYPLELEHLIPPTEHFEVYDKSSDRDNYYIHLKPFQNTPSLTHAPTNSGSCCRSNILLKATVTFFLMFGCRNRILL